MCVIKGPKPFRPTDCFGPSIGPCEDSLSLLIKYDVVETCFDVVAISPWLTYDRYSEMLSVKRRTNNEY